MCRRGALPLLERVQLTECAQALCERVRSHGAAALHVGAGGERSDSLAEPAFELGDQSKELGSITRRPIDVGRRCSLVDLLDGRAFSDVGSEPFQQCFGRIRNLQQARDPRLAAGFRGVSLLPRPRRQE